jgi:hypothetical protein
MKNLDKIKNEKNSGHHLFRYFRSVTAVSGRENVECKSTATKNTGFEDSVCYEASDAHS